MHKTKRLAAWCAVLMFLPALAMADTSADLAGDTGTAAALQALLSAAGSTPASWLHYAIAVLVGLVLAPWGQNLVEGFIGKSPNFFVRLLAPTILGSVTATLVAFVGKQWGITPQDAALAFATFLGAVHAFNASGFAAEVKGAAGSAVSLLTSPAAQTLESTLLTAAGHPEAAALLGTVQGALKAAVAQAGAVVPVSAAKPTSAPALVQVAIPAPSTPTLDPKTGLPVAS